MNKTVNSFKVFTGKKFTMSLPIKKLYTTKEILLPTNMVVMNLDDLEVSLLTIFEVNPFFFFSSSIWNLFADTYAISIPEKKAESKT